MVRVYQKIKSGDEFAKSLAVALFATMTYACSGGDLDNRMPPPMTENSAYDAKLSAEENKLNQLAQSAQTQEAGFELGAQAEQRSQEYLSDLSANINGKRPEGMPLWEDMFLSLTSDDALLDPDFTLGGLGLVSNFYKQHQMLSGHAITINEQERALIDHENKLTLQQELVQSHDQVIGLMEKVMLDANADIAAQIRVVEDTIKNFDIRIRTMEIDGEKKRKDVGNFERRITILEASVDGVEKELENYPLAAMSLSIKQLHRDFTDAGTKIVNLETDIAKVDLDIQANADALTITNNELIRVKDDLNTKGIGAFQIFVEDFNNNKLKKIKEVVERLVALEALILPPPGPVAGFMGGKAGDGTVINGAAVDGAAIDGAAIDGAAIDGAAIDGAAVNGTVIDGAAVDGAWN